MPRSASPLAPARRVRRGPLPAAAPLAARRRRIDAPRRETVPPELLLAEINRALSERPETATVRVGGRRWVLRSAEAGACNWCETSLVVRVHGTVGPQCFAVLREVIADARARYDLLLAE
ncbi:MAG TPA: hypothetical protein VHG91_14545 [Longimicrobium sp.]|nr:hypothetical protein [Longimicrobium sp.]